MKHTLRFSFLALVLVGCQTHAAAEVQATPAQAQVQQQAQACDVAPVLAALSSGMTGAQLDVPDADGLSPLALAARSGCLPVVIALVGAGADIEHVDAAGWSALHHASSQRHANVADYLLAHGAEQERKTAKGETPLALALAGSRSQFGPQGDGHTTEMVLLSGHARAKLNPTPASHTPSAAAKSPKKPTAKKRVSAKPAATTPAKSPADVKKPVAKPKPKSGA